MYRDIPEETQIRNCYRNRVPKHSTYAITTNGGLSDPEACRLFIGGVDALVLTLEPYALVVCGNYPQLLNTKYPEVRIIPILRETLIKSRPSD